VVTLKIGEAGEFDYSGSQAIKALKDEGIATVPRLIARSLEINGPFNIQFVAKDNDVKVIECNLRSSRSFPFVSKIVKVNFIDLATKVIMGLDVPKMNGSLLDLDYVGVKAPQFSFVRLDEADPTLGVEMASTGEVACLGNDFEEAFLKALLSVGYSLEIHNVLLSTGRIEDKAALLNSARLLKELRSETLCNHRDGRFPEK